MWGVVRCRQMTYYFLFCRITFTYCQMHMPDIFSCANRRLLCVVSLASTMSTFSKKDRLYCLHHLIPQNYVRETKMFCRAILAGSRPTFSLSKKLCPTFASKILSVSKATSFISSITFVHF